MHALTNVIAASFWLFTSRAWTQTVSPLAPSEAQAQRAPIPLQVFIPMPPWAFRADTQWHLCYEIYLTNLSSSSWMVQHIDVKNESGADLDIVQRDGAEWTRFGSYIHQPLASVPVLPRGATKLVTIGPEGYAEWRAVAPVQVTITTTGAWHLYDPAFTTVANGKGKVVTSLPVGEGLGYLTLFGDPGQTITVAVKSLSIASLAYLPRSFQ